MYPHLELALRIFTAIGGLAAIGMLLRIRLEKRKLKAETAKVDLDAQAVLAGTALSLVGPLREEITACHVETWRLKQLLARYDDVD